MYSREKLNDYLNEICNYLEPNHSFLLDNIYRISILNDKVLDYINQISLKTKTIQNHLTFEDIFLLAREVIKKIDKNYLTSFDQLIPVGELEFDYEKKDTESRCVIEYLNKTAIKQTIHISREFNYNDVSTLVHEFIHYTNGKKDTNIRDYFTEFLSIYFELYTNLYLFKKGIPNNEIDSYARLKYFKNDCVLLNKYEIILLAYTKFGPLDDSTISLLQKYFLNIPNTTFEKECTSFYHMLSQIEKKHFLNIKNNPKEIGRFLSEEFLTKNYHYVLGTILAFYALKFIKFEDVVFLNNHIHEYERMSISSVCSRLGIDINEPHFLKNVILSIEDYRKTIQTTNETRTLKKKKEY